MMNNILRNGLATALLTVSSPALAAPIQLDCTTVYSGTTKVHSVTVDPELGAVTFDGTVFKDNAPVDTGSSNHYDGSHQYVRISSTMIEFGQGFGTSNCVGSDPSYVCHEDLQSWSIDRTTGEMKTPYAGIGETGSCARAAPKPTKF